MNTFLIGRIMLGVIFVCIMLVVGPLLLWHGFQDVWPTVRAAWSEPVPGILWAAIGGILLLTVLLTLWIVVAVEGIRALKISEPEKKTPGN